ncbi:MAG: cation:proton antiporter [Bacteroidota bacterium]
MEIIQEHQQTISLLIGFVIIAISSNQIAKLFQRINLPLITGLIFTGIIAGPHLLALIPMEAPTQLVFINETALAFIAFAAGSELYLRELRSRINSIKWNTFGKLVVTFVLGSILLFALADYIPFLASQTPIAKAAICTITAAVFVARSPASAIAVINELRAKGPFTQTVMGVTVVKDFLVIVLFSVCLSIGQSLIYGRDFNVISLLFVLIELAASFVIGFFAFGWLLKFALSFKIRRIAKIILVLLVGYGAYALSGFVRVYSEELVHHRVFLEPLLMCILASFRVTNFSRYRPEFLQILHEISIPIYVAFFTLTGASLSINVLGQVMGVALILFGIRLVTMVIGGYVGGYLAKDPMQYNHVGWMPYITQAGVALGLATVVANEFPDWGPQFATVIVAVIVLNQFIGPPLFKWAIFKVGEDRTRAVTPDFDGVNDALIVGYESQSVALARQLLENGWQVKIATKKGQGSFTEPEDVPMLYFDQISKETFDEFEMQKVDAVVCMLSDEENLEVCEMAYHEYGTKDLVVRLNHRFNSNKFLALDAIIVDPSTAIVSLMDHLVRSPQATSLLLGMEEGQDTRDIKLTNSALHGIPLRDLRLPSDIIILSIARGGQTIISHGYTRLRINDIVTVVGSVQSLDKVQFKFEQ